MTTTHTSAADGADQSRPRREELRAFLRSRRARVRPEDVGLPGRGLRRTPGLRREEVATLAGIGVSWYTWLEQGRVINVSDSVVESISRVLTLNRAERAYLYQLVGLQPPEDKVVEDAAPMPELRRLVDVWSPYPAYVLDRWWNFIIINRSAQAVFGLRGHGQNCLVSFFTDEKYRSFFANWDTLAPQVVADFRGAAAAYSDDQRFAVIACRLRQESPDFARLWDQHDVRKESNGTKSVLHPVMGEMTFDHLVLHPSSRHDLRVTVHLPREGFTARRRLERLLESHPAVGDPGSEATGGALTG
ncbi:helix-turn-helix transcriptional regulator [Streptomyces sp. 71268]|uniref:helix-turn-helix transcriptional regulator n=1 Tax=Streptomyces sp. 71268 TaxID=3002640 RepID=UPI0023F70A9A|nr:helix-turn-helix transcriptional regulator [Streptomyces sp. 71268]WEV24252.1 helix-turn-helix transcriptional regulator [Streptomyces sp. 71268]